MKEYAVSVTMLLIVSADDEESAVVEARHRLEDIVYDINDVNDIEVSILKGE